MGGPQPGGDVGSKSSSLLSRELRSSRRWAGFTDPHLATPGGGLQACRWRIETDLAEMAGEGWRITWTRFPGQQAPGEEAPGAREEVVKLGDFQKNSYDVRVGMFR